MYCFKDYSREDVTQVVRLEPFEGEMYLCRDDKKGFSNTINMPYMLPVHNYVEDSQEHIEKMKSNIIFLTPKHFLSEQAAFVLERVWAGYDTYAQNYLEDLAKEYGVSDKDDIDDRRSQKNILLIQPEKAQMPGKFFLTFSKLIDEYPKPEANSKYGPYKVLVEYDNLIGDKEIIDEIRKIASMRYSRIYMSILIGESSESIVKRLVFEYDFQVIVLQSPSMDDYWGYANQFINKNRFYTATTCLKKVLMDLKIYRGESFIETDIYVHLERAFRKAERRGESTDGWMMLSNEDLEVTYYQKNKAALKQLSGMIGLDTIKTDINRQIKMKQLIQKNQFTVYGHMVFSGPPGVGKSVVARLYAQILNEEGISGGNFVDVSRSDLIGKYIGETALNVRGVFEKANGGVIFVDEASFLNGSGSNTGNSDSFVKEAVIELVRFMELYPQTTVIFATYPNEVEKLLNCDPGFSSRISKVLTFDTYSDDELFQIFEYMAKERKFVLDPGVKESVIAYLGKIKNKENFGNAREMRKLLEISMEEFSLNCDKVKQLSLNAEQVAEAGKILLKMEDKLKKQVLQISSKS